MELKLVYRALRKISDWSVNGYYSETCVEGRENVPGPDTPLVLASTHHNEIIDIAVLSITIPHARHVSFWAKSTMFKNPLMGAVLSSSGAIPVKRNPNASASSSSHLTIPASDDPQAAIPTPRTSLFHHTSLALSRNGVVGVFPEGTSYTQPGIVQVMPGAGWAAVEYLHWGRRGGQENGKRSGKAKAAGGGLKIIPVAIVYTDKARYRSRVCVKYGEPIDVDEYAPDLFSEGNEALDDLQGQDQEMKDKAVVRKIMQRVEEQLKAMTVNAADWDTICAVSTARSILWDDEDEINLKDWVDVSQRLVKLLSPPPTPSNTDAEQDAEAEAKKVAKLRRSLTTYNALLHYTGTKHSILNTLLPLPSLTLPTPASSLSTPSLLTPTLRILPTLPGTLLSLLLILPTLPLHIPAYISGYTLSKVLAPPHEDEAVAQFRVVGGGVGMGLGVAGALSSKAVRTAGRGVVHSVGKTIGDVLRRSLSGTALLDSIVGSRFFEAFTSLWDGEGGEGWVVALKRASLLAGGVYLGVWALVRWYGTLVDANYKNLQRILTYHKLLRALLFTSSSRAEEKGADESARAALSEEEWERYTRPPVPAENVFIRRTKAKARSREASSDSSISISISYSSEPEHASLAGAAFANSEHPTIHRREPSADPQPHPPQSQPQPQRRHRQNPPPPSSSTQLKLLRLLLEMRPTVSTELREYVRTQRRDVGLGGWVGERGARV